MCPVARSLVALNEEVLSPPDTEFCCADALLDAVSSSIGCRRLVT